MGDRSYLSIGDVLALLREEFPDVTISKIRFLESRGLLVPERTPSGYRKFYEHDVERLRWILRQQREHFLPLKVIKGRLEGADTEAESLFDTGETPPADLVARAQTNGAAVGLEREPVSAVATARRRGGYTEDEESPGRGELAAAAEEASHVVTASHPSARSSQAARSRPAAEARPSPRPKPAEAPEPAADERPLVGTTFTVNELAQASGLSPEQVEELESFGLIEGRTVAGVHCYDEDSVVVAGLSANFGRYGIEARHLRMFKHAAERQAGLYTQVVMPLLRQRNPAARERANEDLLKLAELGASLQSAFLKAVLRDMTGG